jgi:hypothetical protein
VSTTDNGWPASPTLPLRPLVVNGVAFVPGILDNADVETVLRYCMEQFAARVEPLRIRGCWGFSYRPNRNSPNALSRHSGGIAVDANAPDHPNGVPADHTFSAGQVAEIHAILAEVDHAVRWGGDYHGTPDAMHFEIDTDAASLHAVAERLRDDMPAPKDWDAEDWAAFDEHVWGAEIGKDRTTARQVLNKFKTWLERQKQ